ncbi:MAG TPA: glycosyl hydrolase family 28-related protein, partial [Planctomycetota bacterium]|nr:glycosyl hydrolase family 28-related protein [Planctomycetota bacterium]
MLASLVLTIVTVTAADTGADLWQQYVADPNRHPLIPNCSYAGYQCGDVALPEPAVVLDLAKDFGAKPDGSDTTAAFAAAIGKAATLGKPGKPAVIGIPKGTFTVSGLIRLDRSGVVLRGAGHGETIIAFQKPLDDVVGASKAGTSSRWSWSGGLVWLGPSDVFGGDGRFITPADTQGWEEWQDLPAIAKVSAPAKRGDHDLQVDADGAKALKSGDTLLLCWANPSDRSLLLHMAGHELMASYDWEKSGQGLTSAKAWRWPVEIAAVKGTTVTLRQPLRIDIRPEWQVRFAPLGAHVRETGIERLTLHMPAHDAGKHLTDKGWNGVYLNRALHCWVREVTIDNPDNAVIHALAKNTTVTGFIITGGK